MTADPKVSSLRLPLIVVGEEPEMAILDAKLNVLAGMEFETDAAQIVRCVNAHDGLVEALEEARCTVRMVHREFNSDRFTDRYGDGEIATRRLALIDAALAAAKEGK